MFISPLCRNIMKKNNYNTSQVFRWGFSQDTNSQPPAADPRLRWWEMSRWLRHEFFPCRRGERKNNLRRMIWCTRTFPKKVCASPSLGCFQDLFVPSKTNLSNCESTKNHPQSGGGHRPGLCGSSSQRCQGLAEGATPRRARGSGLLCASTERFRSPFFLVGIFDGDVGWCWGCFMRFFDAGFGSIPDPAVEGIFLGVRRPPLR